MARNVRPKIKHERESPRDARREAKAEKAIWRCTDKLVGIAVEDLPPDYQGLARFLSGADQ